MTDLINEFIAEGFTCKRAAPIRTSAQSACLRDQVMRENSNLADREALEAIME